MEIISKTAETPLDIIDLGDITDQAPPPDLEITDLPKSLIPGSVIALIPGAGAEAPKKTTWKDDGDCAHFLEEIEVELDKIPAHSGRTTVGCERAIAFLKAKDSEISRAIRGDFDNKIDEHRAEACREKIWEMIDRLEDALGDLIETKTKKRKKKTAVRIGKQVVARINDGEDIQHYVVVQQGQTTELLPITIAEPTDEQVKAFVEWEDAVNKGMTKEAHTARISLVIDPFIHEITRILINSHVSAGRNIEDVYSMLKTKYGFTEREELSIQGILREKGLPIFKDFGRLGEKEVRRGDGLGIEFNTTYAG